MHLFSYLFICVECKNMLTVGIIDKTEKCGSMKFSFSFHVFEF